MTQLIYIDEKISQTGNDVIFFFRYASWKLRIAAFLYNNRATGRTDFQIKNIV